MSATQDVESSMMQEDHDQALRGVTALLKMTGRKMDDPSIAETPNRVVKAFREMIHGYHQHPAGIMKKVFECDTDELIIVTGIDFVSLCEHHLLPFTGTATVGYFPSGKVIGLS